MKTLSQIALILVIIGALNWLLVGLFQWDLVAALLGPGPFGESSIISRIVYALVGLGGLYLIPQFFLKENRVKVD
ncbi:MAG: DUF378 domain-containing protein [Bacillota bacterium]